MLNKFKIGNRVPSDKKPFKVGDIVKVSQDMKWGNGESDINKEILLNAPSVITEIQGEYALLEGAGESVYGLIPLKHLFPTPRSKSPKNGERVDFSSSSLQNRKNLTENDISSMPKEIAEDLSNLMAEVDNFIKRNRTSQVDWLAYRMELAKEVLKEVMCISITPDCEEVVNRTMSIVDGVVERLKEGLK